MKVYFISGLAADSRVFRHIELPPHCEAIYIEWIQPQKKESLRHYAYRLAENIDISEPFALVGLSMGGMMAAEIATQLKPVTTILISSVPSHKQLPFYFKVAGKLQLHKCVPISLVKSAAKIKRVFTTETEEDRQMLRTIINESDNQFIHWAMDAVLKWKSDQLPASYVHIHGTKDEVLPIRFTQPTHTIPNAGHLMIMNRAKEVNRILKEVLSQ